MQKKRSIICSVLVVVLLSTVVPAFASNGMERQSVHSESGDYLLEEKNDYDNVENMLSTSIKLIELKNAVPFYFKRSADSGTSRSLADLGNISTKYAIVVNGKTNYLYPTFDDIHQAVGNLETVIPQYFKYVKGKVDLKSTYGIDYEDLMKTSFEPNNEALKSLNEALQLGSISEENEHPESVLTENQKSLYKERDFFEGFYDIYENESKNRAIKELIESSDDIDYDKLAYLLPYNTPFVKDYFENNPTTAMVNAQYFNRSDGRKYAIKYANNSNSAEYGTAKTWYLGEADCTNFASQILVAGGIQMHNDYPDVSLGWWHEKYQDWNSTDIAWRHAYSNSWQNADSFVRFMGTSGNEYSSFCVFSGKLISGDHIALDSERDGDWNHIGFVCDIGTYGTYYYDGTARYYRDFTVAQHTKNYYAWTSSATNGWENGSGTANYAIVRRNAAA